MRSSSRETSSSPTMFIERLSWRHTPRPISSRLCSVAVRPFGAGASQSETSTDTMLRIVCGPYRSIVPGRQTSICEMLVSAHSVSMWIVCPRAMRTGRRR